MVRFRGYISAIVLAGTVSAALAAPTLGVAGDLLSPGQSLSVSLNELGSIGSFTPTIRDEKLSSAYAKASLNRGSNAFRFTPTSGSMSGRREITVLVRADLASAGKKERAPAAPVAIEPLAFNLDASRGWRKFALPETVGRKPLDPVVSSELSGVKNFSLENKGHSRLQANVQLDTNRDLGTAAQSLAGERPYSVDVTSSYSLTRNLNVTAGVRYGGADNRLTPITDQRQDSQAVYVGTIFKF